MHLTWSGSSYKGKTYKYWQLAESVRVGNTVNKKIIANLGSLSDEKVKQIRMICKVFNGDNKSVLTTLENVIPIKAVDYLELAVANAIWDKWELDEAFKEITSSNLDTIKIARLLTLNRCTYPKSHYAVVKWFKQTALAEILQIDAEKLSDDKLYYELDKIERNKSYIEYILFKKTFEADKSSYDFINYDLTTSYFVGTQCSLAWYGRSKDHRPDYKQVVLGLTINKHGYPFKWDVYPGNQPETKTLERNVMGCMHRFDLKEITLVFDRGLVSKNNLSFIENSKGKLKYICVLDKDQIAGVAGDTLKLFRNIETDRKKLKKNLKKQLPDFFSTKDERFYFKDIGVGEQIDKRCILSFSPTLCEEKRKLRKQIINIFISSLQEINDELLQAQRNRSPKTTKKKVQALVDKLKLEKFVSKIELSPITLSRKRASGKLTDIQTYQITVSLLQDTLAQEAILDGVCVFVTTHVEKCGDRFLVPAEDIISAYHQKSAVEDAFKHMKSFLKIRPFYVNLESHVKAVYTICVLAYFINMHLARLRSSAKGKDKGKNFLNSCELYDPFRSCKLVSNFDNLNDKISRRPVEYTSKQIDLLKSLNLQHLLRPQF